MTAKQKSARRRKRPPLHADPREVDLCRAWGCYGCRMCCPRYVP